LQSYVLAIKLDSQGQMLMTGPAHFTGEEHLESQIDQDLGASDFSIAAWIRTKHGGTIWSKHTGGKWEHQSKSIFVYRAGTVAFDVGMVGQIESKKTVHDGQWHHVVLTYKKIGQLATLYIDGEWQVADELPMHSDPTDHMIQLGHTGLNFGGNFRGYLRNVYLTPRVVGREAIQDLFADSDHGDILDARRVHLSAQTNEFSKCVASVSHRWEDSHPPERHPNADRSGYQHVVPSTGPPATDTQLDRPAVAEPDDKPAVVAAVQDTMDMQQAEARARARRQEEEFTKHQQEQQPGRDTKPEDQAAAQKAAEDQAAAQKAAEDQAAASKAAEDQAAASKAAEEQAAASKAAEEQAAEDQAAAEEEAEAAAKMEAQDEAQAAAAAEAEAEAAVEAELAEAEVEAEAEVDSTEG